MPAATTCELRFIGCCRVPDGDETGARHPVIDMIVIVSIHGLLLLAGYRLMLRDDLDEDPLLDGEGDDAP